MVLLFISVSLSEVTGVALLIPFMTLVENPNSVLTHPRLHFFFSELGFQAPRSFVLFSGVVVITTLLLGNALTAFSTWASLRFVMGEQAWLGTRLLRSYLSSRYVWFLRQNTAVLCRNVLNEVAQLYGSVLLPLLRLISRLAVTIFITLGLLIISPVAAFASAALLGGFASVVWTFTRARLQQLGNERLEVDRRRYMNCSEALQSAKTTIVFGREATLVDRYSRDTAQAGRISASQNVLTETPRNGLEVVAFGGLVALLLVLVWKEIPLNDVLPVITAFAFATYRLMPAVQQSFTLLTVIKSNLPSLALLHAELFESEERELQPVDGADFRFDREIRLTDLHFAYPETQRNVLNGLTLEIEKGASYGIVGSTGAGKTTLVDILLGLLTPDSGEIRVDERVLTEQSSRSWRKLIGYVPQDIFLMDDDLAQNISFSGGEAEPDEHAVREAAELASLHDFVTSLPEGYATRVGERGVRLSGGQKQRLGIARALYRDPEILVLDEATSSLDGVTEEVIMEAIRKLSGKKTMVIVAHRLSTLRHCDAIYMLDKGKVIAKGDYQTLLATNAEFRAMAKEEPLEEQRSPLAIV